MTKVKGSSSAAAMERRCNLDCGGTLVFDERGNLLSWFRKPGTEHLTHPGGRSCAAPRDNAAPTQRSEGKEEQADPTGVGGAGGPREGQRRKAALLHTWRPCDAAWPGGRSAAGNALHGEG